jgi:hypothetical protein
MNKIISFDMDGTIADFYGVENWLEKIRNFDASPYLEAHPLLPLNQLARLLNDLQKNGYTIRIISWLSKESNVVFDELTRRAKRLWLAHHLPSVCWDEIHIVKYGTPKHFIGSEKGGVLFDDNEEIRRLWDKYGEAYEPSEILEVLRRLI